LESIDDKIAGIRSKIEDVKKRWPFHSAKPELFQELEDLELELEALMRQKRAKSSRPDRS